MSYQQGEKKEKLQVQKSENVSCPPHFTKPSSGPDWSLCQADFGSWALYLTPVKYAVAAEVQEEIFFSFFSLRMENEQKQCDVFHLETINSHILWIKKEERKKEEHRLKSIFQFVDENRRPDLSPPAVRNHIWTEWWL